jgi:hypothetical protein
MKTCSKCKKEYPATREYFYKHKQSSDSLFPSCKKCHNKLKCKPTISSSKVYAYKWGSGVYGIFENGVCLYVGESTKLYRRICDHHTGYKNPQSANNKQRIPFYKKIQKHSKYVIGILEQCDNHKEREQFYINKLKPLYNGK